MRLTIALIAALVILGAPVAHAQDEHVLVDSVIELAYAGAGYCMQVDRGAIIATVQSVGDPNANVRLLLGPEGNGNFPGQRVNTSIATMPNTYMIPVVHPVICWYLKDESVNLPLTSPRVIAVKLVWLPPVEEQQGG